jgi:esterase/lipase
MKHVFGILIFIFSQFLIAQNPNAQNLEINDFIDGTLLQPEKFNSKTLAVIIAGSGPTNRDGNQTVGKNNSLKMLAEYFADQGIASFRYDKRIFKLAKEEMLDESKLRFDDFVEDAADVVNYFKLYNEEDYGFENFILVGHSQGALVAQLASLRTAVNGLILLCGTAQPIDQVMVSQINKQAPFLTEDLKKAFDSIKTAGYVNEYNPLLKTVLRKDVQPFMASWMKYDPKAIAQKIEIPALVVGGTTDIQVPAEEAKILSENFQNANYAIIENMNHILKTIDDIGLENQKTYMNPNLRLSEDLKIELSKFLEKFK